MPKEFKTERAAQQQRLLCQGLVELMETRPYGEITVSGICAHTGIPRRTFYYYFDSREDVLAFLMDGLLKKCDLESMLFDDRRQDALEQGLTRFFQYWREDGRRALQVIVHNGLEQDLMMYCMRWAAAEERWTQLMENYSEEAQSVSMMLGITAVFYTLFHWCTRGFRNPPEYMAACVTRILTNPLYETDI